MSAEIVVVCSHCYSDNVRRDAWAAWNSELQQWELSAVMDQGYCEECGGEARLIEQPIEPPHFTTSDGIKTNTGGLS